MAKKASLGDPTAAGAWHNAIVGYGEVAPETLLPNPHNWRTHPTIQKDAMTGALAELGWLQTVTVNRSTGHLIDGHLRVALALAHKQPCVPVTYVDISEDQERLALLTVNPLGTMAEANKAALQDLLAFTNTCDAALHQVLDALAIEHQLLPPLWDDAPPSVLQEDGRDGRGADMIDMTPVPAPASNVRMVQLFLTEETYPIFQSYIKALAPHYAVTTVTDTVMECLSHAVAASDKAE